jgi:hypothetical protein
MKNVFLIFILASFNLNVNAQNPINAIIGDVSYNAFLLMHPNVVVTENQRIQIHLNYVKNLLQSKNTKHLTVIQKEKRFKIIALLQQYINEANFPQNIKYNDRRPCFIDDNNNICAVGYLIANTIGLNAAIAINNKHQYDYINDIKSDVLEKWIIEYGLTKEECATIQPSYWPTPNNSTETLDRKTATTTALYTGINLSSSLINLFPSNNTKSKALPIIGIVTSVAQIHFGFKKYPKIINNWGVAEQNKSEKNASMLNIAVGTTNLLLSTWRLTNIAFINKEKKKNSKSQIGIFVPQTINNSFAAGLSFSRNI